MTSLTTEKIASRSTLICDSSCFLCFVRATLKKETTLLSPYRGIASSQRLELLSPQGDWVTLQPLLCQNCPGKQPLTGNNAALCWPPCLHTPAGVLSLRDSPKYYSGSLRQKSLDHAPLDTFICQIAHPLEVDRKGCSVSLSGFA